MARRKAKLVDDDDDDDDAPLLLGYVEPPSPWDSGAIVKKLDRILDRLGVEIKDLAAKSELQRCMWRRDKFAGCGGQELVISIVRAIAESEGNGEATPVEPIVGAVANCARPEWTSRGRQWIEAFAQVPLLEILREMRELEIFTASEIRQHLETGIKRKLWRIFGPDQSVKRPRL